MGSLSPTLFTILFGDILYRDGVFCLDLGLNEPRTACAALRMLTVIQLLFSYLIRVTENGCQCPFYANGPNPIYPIAGWVPTSSCRASAA